MCVGTDKLCTYDLYTHTCSHEYTCIRTGAYDLEEQMRKEICEEEMPEGGAGVPLRGKSRARQVCVRVCVSVCVCVCFAATCIHYIHVGGMFACVFTCMSAVKLRLALHQISPILHLDIYTIHDPMSALHQTSLSYISPTEPCV